MGSSAGETATRILARITEGDRSAWERLVPLVYDELRALAAEYLRHERPGHTLQPTALVHEAYLRLIDQKNAQWTSKAHFFSVAARAMRQLLVEHARTRRAVKRGGARQKVTLDEVVAPPGANVADLLDLDTALAKLAAMDERMSRIVELRFFGSLTIAETAHVLELSTATVEDDWAVARAWFAKELHPEGVT